MVVFNTKYFNEREQFQLSEIGATTPPFREIPAALDEKFRQGLKLVEVTLGDYPAHVVQSRQGSSIPVRAYGKDQRQEIKELKEANKATLHVHAGPNIQMVAFDQRGNYNEEASSGAMRELEETINFAHDIGAKQVIIHLIGSPKPINEFGEKFEPKGINNYAFVDKKNKKILEGLSSDMEFSFPVIKQDEKGNLQFEYNEKGELVFSEKRNVEDWINHFIETGEAENRDQAIQKLGQRFLIRNKLEAEGKYKHYSNMAKKSYENYNILNKIMEIKENPKIINELSEEETGKIMQYLTATFGEKIIEKSELPDYIRKHLSEKFEKEVEIAKTQWLSSSEQAAAFKQNVEHINKIVNNIVPLHVFQEEETVNRLTNLALHSYARSKETGNLVKIAPENLHPRHFGSHPEDLRRIVKTVREKVKEELIKKHGVEKKEAEELSKELVGITWDMGHLNMWRHHWSGSDEEFEEWFLKETEKVAKEELIGNVQVNDNFGYLDDSLAIGEVSDLQVNALKRIKKLAGKVPIVSEGYGQPRGQEHRQITRVWETINPNIYHVPFTLETGRRGYLSGSSETKYFHAPRSGYHPTFLVGPTAPSEGFKFWSEVPLE